MSFNSSRFNSGDTALEQLAAIAQYTYPQFNAFKNKLNRQMEPAVIAVQGDSTGNNVNEWVYLLAQWFASRFPYYTVKHSLWNDTLQCYDTPTTVSVGTAGKAYAQHTNVNTDAFVITDSTALHITGDIDLRIHCNADSWISGAGQVLISKLGAGDERAFSLYISSIGKPTFYWSPDGTAGALRNAVSTVALPTQNGTDLWIRCTLDVDNGASGYTAKFYTGADGIAWTQLGTDVIVAGTTAIGSNTSAIGIGYGTTGKFYGKIYSAEVRSGIDGVVLASPDFGMAFPVYVSTANGAFNDSQGNVIYRMGFSGGLSWGNGSPMLLFLNGSLSGATLSYSADETRFALQHVLEADINFISYSHNEGTTTNYITAYLAYCDQLVTKWPAMAIIPIAQNPQTSATGNYLYHNHRCQQIAKMAVARKYLCIDIFTKFTESGRLNDYINEDGVHPSILGSIFWKDCIANIFQTVI
jgi:lysophospholipase L1-like esterase